MSAQSDTTAKFIVRIIFHGLLMAAPFLALAAAIVILRIHAGAYWIVMWVAFAASWPLAKRLMAAKQQEVLGCTIEGPATGARGEALLRFISDNGGRDVELQVLVPGESDRMQAAYSNRSGTRIIYLTRNMLEQMNDRELHAVVAHELVHHRRRWRLALSGVAGFAVRVMGVFLAGELALPGQLGPMGAGQSLRAVPLVAMYCWSWSLMCRPAMLAISRRSERVANAMALEITGDPAAFISAMKQLARNNRISGKPGILDKLLVNTHPSLNEVVAQAHSYAAEQGIELSEQDAGNQAPNRVC